MAFQPKSIFASLPVTQRGANFHLTADPKNEKFVYCSGTAVYIRDLKNPLDVFAYNEHAGTPTAACYAPSGFYMCSGDSHGKVRVWDTTQDTHILKYEGNAIGGSVRDIVWSPDSKRIVVVGIAGDKRSHCFLWDSGSSCGLVATHTKNINAVAHSPDRPYRLVTVGEDYNIFFHHGVPYKCISSLKDGHSNFVNSVRYCPKGTSFCTVSSDKKALLWDGKTGDKLGQLKDNGEFAHNGGIMAVSYSADGAQIMTASADKTVKIWDAGTQQCVSTFAMGKDIADQQLGCLWAGDYLLSVSFSGNINYLDPNSNEIVKVIRGHQKSIESLACSGSKIITSSFEGRVACWDSETGAADYLSGAGHKNKVMDMRVTNDTLVSADIEEKIVRTPLNSLQAGDNTSSLPSKVNYMDVHDNGIEIYSCVNELVLFKNGNQVCSHKTKYEPYGVAIGPGGNVLAVAAHDEPKIYVYDIDGDTLIQRQEIELSSSCTELAYSRCGAWLAGAMTNRIPVLLEVNNHYKVKIHCWSAQAKLTSVDFSPDSTLLAVGGIDSNILVCKVDKPMDSAIKITRAHPQAPITRVRWLNNNTVVSTGSDFQVRQWIIN